MCVDCASWVCTKAVGFWSRVKGSRAMLLGYGLRGRFWSKAM